VLISKTPLVRSRDLFKLSTALEQNASECARAWGLAPPAIEVADSTKGLPKGCNPVFFVDDDGDPGVLAEHFFDPLRGGPAARVYVTAGSGFNRGKNSACEAASHEIVEALVNPRLTLWAPYPGRPGVIVAVENADPVQTHYQISAGNESWTVSNFVTPAWFDPTLLDETKRKAFLAAGGKFDQSGELKFPGEIGPYGYAITRKDGRAALMGPAVAPSKKHAHPLSRTKQLLEQAA
ncbi:MAG TPA: hypothetical protein VHO25_22000, partial [Polyangiaceae bacterium]|nr:hypothetical protein [Polyangiaceae bacterium]